MCAQNGLRLLRSVPRHAQHTEHFIFYISHYHWSPKVDHIQNPLRRSTRRVDGFTDPEPRTGYEPKMIVDNPTTTEQEIAHSSEESQITEIVDKGLICDPFSLHPQPVIVVLLKAMLWLKKQTWTTNKFVLCWLHHGTFRSEKQVRNDRKFITLKEKAQCPVHLKV